MKKQKQDKLHGAQTEAHLKRQLAEIERAALAAMNEGSSIEPPMERIDTVSAVNNHVRS